MNPEPTTDVAMHGHTGAGLAITRDQHAFTDVQRAAMAHIGVQDAPEADLQVFLHHCQRTGLDPFARQIYMIGRSESYRDDDGAWRKRQRWTIQTGIDGFRLIGHRAARRDRVTVGTRPVEFLHPDGGWRPAWSKAWGVPIAARFTLVRDEQEFYGLANYDEYVDCDENGRPRPNRMWKNRPAGQLAKCSEALAWRSAFPQDLSGMYIDEELQHADEPVRELRTGIDAVRVAAQPRKPEPAPSVALNMVTGEVVESTPVGDPPAMVSDVQRRQIVAGWGAAGITSDPRTSEGKAERGEYIRRVIGRDVASAAALTFAEAEQVIGALEQDAAAAAEAQQPADDSGESAGEGE